jgi:hypothetical protein
MGILFNSFLIDNGDCCSHSRLQQSFYTRKWLRHCGGLPWSDLKRKKPGILFAEPKETSYDNLLATFKKLIPIMRLMID